MQSSTNDATKVIRKSGPLPVACKQCQKKKTKCNLDTPCPTCRKTYVIHSRDHNLCSSNETYSGVTCTRELPEPYQGIFQSRLDRIHDLERLLEESSSGAVSRNSVAPNSPISRSVLRDLLPRSSPSPLTTPPIHFSGSDPLSASAGVNTSDSQSTLPRRTPSFVADQGNDAAQVLEFLAWGRRKDQVFHEAPENESGPRQHTESDEGRSHLMNAARTPQLEMLQMLLPSQDVVKTLVDFHSRCLSWYHGCYNSVTFVKELEEFYSVYRGSLHNQPVNLQWMALTFAILTGSITCASDSNLSLWGFNDIERSRLAREWYRATITCLNLSDYLETHTIYSVQAVSTLTISAHIIGMSNSQSVLLASANRIAQSLGLHRLGSEPTPTETNLSTEAVAKLRKRETGRRVWCQLCTQDWFSIPFSESFALNPQQFNTGKPMNCNDDSDVPLLVTTPSVTSYCNYLYDIAALMPQLQTAMNMCKTDFTKYEQVLSYDEKMRELATRYMPTFLSSNSPVTTALPVFTTWARRSLAICAAHKIIMIHRKFLGQSFTNPASFSFTRRTCIAASKTIIKEVQAASDQNGPVLWIDQAFTVAAGIILCLDAYHREKSEPEFEEHKNLVKHSALSYLSKFSPFSKIASRGITLLSFLVNELGKPDAPQPSGGGNISSRKHHHGEGGNSGRKRRRTFEPPPDLSLPPTNSADGADSHTDFAYNAFTEMLGFGDQYIFDNWSEFDISQLGNIV
jgi:hypothetical protein